jgi:hypothetical protein
MFFLMGEIIVNLIVQNYSDEAKIFILTLLIKLLTEMLGYTVFNKPNSLTGKVNRSTILLYVTFYN